MNRPLAPTPGEPIHVFPSSPASGGDPVYDEIQYNSMLVDVKRHEFFQRSMVGLVEDRVVVDVGTGRDALLARFCIEAGARKVYAIELLPWAAERAKAIVEKLGLADRIIVIQGRAQDVVLPEKADVCVSENVGNIAGAETGDHLVAIARERFLKPGGAAIPSRVQSLLAAVSLPAEFLERPCFGDLGAYYAEKCWEETGYRYDMRLSILGVDRSRVRSTTGIMERLDFSVPAQATAEEKATITITQDGPIDGFLVWLNLEGGLDHALETLDFPDSWLPVYLPALDEPVAVRTGDLIHLTVRSELTPNGFNRDYHLRGHIEREGATIHEFAFTSWHYRESYQGNPFYARLFANDQITRPIAPTKAPEKRVVPSGHTKIATREKTPPAIPSATRPPASPASWWSRLWKR